MQQGQIRMGGFNILPTGVKNLLIINVLLFLATVVFQRTGLVDLDRWLGMHYFSSQLFQPWQPITYMFMHANFGHLFFNMFALWMFGAAVENAWGTKRFLLYYFITGMSAGMMYYLVIFFQIHPTIALMDQFLADPSLDSFRVLATQANGKYLSAEALQQTLAYLEHSPSALQDVINNVVSSKEAILNQFNLVGASGAVFALLLAFGMLFPNAEIYIYFLFPIKAKWFVVIYGALELIYGVAGTGDGVAYFAHLSGMLVGLILILLWRNGNRNSRGNNPFRTSWINKAKKKFYVSQESGRPISDEDYNERKTADRQRVDEILDKISANGYASLTEEEKDFLFHQSNKS